MDRLVLLQMLVCKFRHTLSQHWKDVLFLDSVMHLQICASKETCQRCAIQWRRANRTDAVRGRLLLLERMPGSMGQSCLPWCRFLEMRFELHKARWISG